MKVDPEDLVKCRNCAFCQDASRKQAECTWAWEHGDRELPYTILSPDEFKWCTDFSPTLAWTVKCMKADLEGLRSVVQSLLDKYEGE
jgi:hypothetical protein